MHVHEHKEIVKTDISNIFITKNIVFFYLLDVCSPSWGKSFAHM